MGMNEELAGITREEEDRHLEKVIAIADKNLEHAKKSVEDFTNELHELLETYSTKDKEALVFWNNTKVSLNEATLELQRCQRARKKPYFGRIDLIDAKTKKEESYYIGKVGIKDTVTDRVVIDWRAPMATVYYENSLGPCKYSVRNVGEYDIELTRKRTYEIVDDKLIDFYDSEVVANDELLTKYLAKSKKAVLGDIIATIQKEQNLIIRKSPRNNILVQGVAGSGKTTVAMHRISYILYNYESEFRPKDFYIVGSNRILLNYITSVLPDLDVYGISQMTMEQLFVRLLYEDWDEKKYRIRTIKNGEEAAYIKGGYQWFHALVKYCADYEWENLFHDEVRTENTNRVLIEKEELEAFIKQNDGISFQNKVLLLNERVMARLENEISGRDISYTPEMKQEMKRYYQFFFGKNIWKGSIFELYDNFIQQQKEQGLDVVWNETEFDVYDLAGLAYLYKRIKETDMVREASHVVIDEAQDFGMMAYASLYYCLRGCTYTIMGDVSQNIHYGTGLNDWEELKGLILKSKFDTFGLLKKSYRNTVEISNFATGILRHGTFQVYPVEPIIRHGKEVELTKCLTEGQLVDEAVKQIQMWKEEGYETIAVICREELEAKEVSIKLQEKVELNDSNLETTEFGSGVMVLPVEYTKGLEFDTVLLWNPSKLQYSETDGNVKLLYVAATRALHELKVIYYDEVTDLIGKTVTESKNWNVVEPEEVKTERVKIKPVVTRRRRVIEEGDLLAGDERRTGPRRITVQGQETVKKEQKTKIRPEDIGSINESPYLFGDVPDATKLHPPGHGKIDISVKWIKKNSAYVDIASAYGLLRITPISDYIIRIQFMKGQIGSFEEERQWIYEQPKAKWACKETRDVIGIATEKIMITLEKKTGVLKFYSRDRKLLLSERLKDARQVENGDKKQVWNYFEWTKKEKIWARGLASSDLLPMNMKARYISFGQKKIQMPFVVSDNGYGLAIASKGTVMCCNIPMYGSYISQEETDKIDYFFIYGASAAGSLELYKRCRCI